MTILIKGMEMPKSCHVCWNCDCNFINATGDYIEPPWCLVKMRPCEADIKDVSRPSWCPLIEVPTPHGRLIDADEFFDKIPPGDIEHDEKISRTGAIADVCTWVLSAPTVIEAEAD